MHLIYFIQLQIHSIYFASLKIPTTDYVNVYDENKTKVYIKALTDSTPTNDCFDSAFWYIFFFFCIIFAQNHGFADFDFIVAYNA